MAATDLCTLNDYKTARGVTDGRDDPEIARLITVASDWLARECGRQFVQDETPSARLYRPPYRSSTLLVDDFSTLSGLVVSDNGSALTIDADFQAFPVGGRSASGELGAWYELERFDGQWWDMPLRGASVSVTARWGFPAVPGPIKQGVIEIVGDLLKVKDNTFGFLGVLDGITAVRLRGNAHVAELVATYRRGDRAPGIGGFA